MKIKLIIIVVALIIFIFGLGYFVWGKYTTGGCESLQLCPPGFQEPGCRVSHPSVCYNGPIPGEPTECGDPCPDREVFNQPWSKYEIATETCIDLIYCSGSGDYQEVRCGYSYRKVSDWYATADKLQPNCYNQSCGASKDGYLAAGLCDPKNSTDFYKVCCNPDGTVGHSGPYFLQDNIDPPTEGVCLAPSKPKMVLSGLDTSIPPGATSTNCTTTVTTTPPESPQPPNPPNLPTRAGGICNPAIKIKVRKGGISDWQEQGVGRVIYNTSTTNIRELKKNDTLEFDVELVNRGTSTSVECGYKTCELKCYDVICTNSTTNTTTTFPKCGELTDNDVAGCSEWSTTNHRCEQWSEEKREIHVNNPDCEIRPGQSVKVNVSLKPNLVYKSIDGSTFTFGVDPKISFGKTFKFLSSIFGFRGIVEHENPNYTAQIQPQRHGTYYVLAEKSSGNVYNVSNEKTVGPGDGIDKKYVWCEVPLWQNGRWEIPTLTGNGPFTLWKGEPTSSIDVSPAQVEFYVKPTEVEPLLEVIPPNIQHPSEIKTATRTYIAGYSIEVNYGVQVDGHWGEDKGVYWLQGYDEGSPSSIDKDGGTQIKTTEILLRHAGKFTIVVSHNADDEKLSQIEENEAIGDLESQSATIQVYRYLCYQGFCWECPDEPEREGTRLKVKEKGCKVVEDIKCQTYAYPNKSCKGGVRE